jgi:hypothetical protein
MIVTRLPRRHTSTNNAQLAFIDTAINNSRYPTQQVSLPTWFTVFQNKKQGTRKKKTAWLTLN